MTVAAVLVAGCAGSASDQRVPTIAADGSVDGGGGHGGAGGSAADPCGSIVPSDEGLADAPCAAPEWRATLGTPGNDVVQASAAGPTGELVLLVHDVAAQSDPMRLVRLDARGAAQWTRSFATTDAVDGRVAIDPLGNIAIIGHSYAPLDFGVAPIVTDAQPSFFFCLFMDPSGEPIWLREWGAGDSPDFIYGGSPSVAFAPEGALIVAGTYIGTTDLGTGPLVSAGDFDFFLAKMATDGSVIWANRYGGASRDWLAALAPGADGTIALVGSYASLMDIGGSALSPPNGNDIFVAKVDGDGAAVWARGFGGPDPPSIADAGSAIATSEAGDIVFAAVIASAVDFGGGPVAYSGGKDGVLVRLDPAGTYISSHVIGRAASDEEIASLELLDSGDARIVAWSHACLAFVGELGNDGTPRCTTTFRTGTSSLGVLAIASHADWLVAAFWGNGGGWTSQGGSDIAVAKLGR